MARISLVRTMLIVGPLLMAGRFMATALWGVESGPGVLGNGFVHDFLLVVVAAMCVLWAVVAPYRMTLSAYLGTIAGLTCVYHALSIFTLHDEFGDAIFVAVTYWISFAVACVTLVSLSVQYNLVHHPHTMEKVAERIHD